MTDAQNLLERISAQRQATQGIVDALTSGESSATILPRILQILCDVLKAGGGRIILASAEGQSFEAGPKADAMGEHDAVLWAFLSQPVVVPDINDAPPNLNLSSLKDTITSMVALPLEANNNQEGILWLGFERPYDLQQDEYEFLEMAAKHIALSIAMKRDIGITMSGIEVAQLLASAHDALVIMDNNGQIQLINRAAQNLFHVDEQAVGKNFKDIVSHKQLLRLLKDVSAETPVKFDFEADDGRFFKPSVSPIIGKHGLQIGKLLIMWDISQYKKINENMSMFLHTVSHDLRSPLTAAKGYVDMLGMVGELNERQSSMIGKIITSITDMTNLVEKVLDAGRLDPEMGMYRLRRELCDPASVIQKVVSTLASAAEYKHITLHTDVSAKLPVLNLDPMMIERALVNLVENAIKYTPENGNVWISGAVQDNILTLSVRDDGPGIPSEHQDRLFLKGERLNRKDHRQVRGSGLGLYIVKNVAQQHGGDARVQSDSADGSEFIITIPLRDANLVGASQPEEE